MKLKFHQKLLTFFITVLLIFTATGVVLAETTTDTIYLVPANYAFKVYVSGDVAGVGSFWSGKVTATHSLSPDDYTTFTGSTNGGFNSEGYKDKDASGGCPIDFFAVGGPTTGTVTSVVFN